MLWDNKHILTAASCWEICSQNFLNAKQEKIQNMLLSVLTDIYLCSAEIVKKGIH
jgi:hypothetical protein